jgi:hypothetical protein
MTELSQLVPGLGAPVTDGVHHVYWWLILAVVVLAFVLPLAFVNGRGDRTLRH